MHEKKTKQRHIVCSFTQTKPDPNSVDFKASTMRAVFISCSFYL